MTKMDPRQNPYAPGAGTPPPELAGRDELIERAAIALDRIRAGKSARSIILHGMRGVGRTVLVNRIRLDAEEQSATCAPWPNLSPDPTDPATFPTS